MHERGVKPEPTPASVPYEMALEALRRGNVEAALGSIEHACAEPDAGGIYHRVRAEILHRCGRLAEAEGAARQAVELDPDEAQSWELLGSLLVGRGELSGGGDCYERAVRIDPGFVQALNNLAVVLHHLGRLREAEERFEEALLLVPDNVEILLNFAALQGALGHYREGLATVEKVLSLSPGTVKAYLLAAELEAVSGRCEVALSWVEKALSVSPGEDRILTHRADILCQLGRFEPALADCDDVLGRHADDPKTLHVRALALQGLNRVPEALEAFGLAEAVSGMATAVIADRAWLLAETGNKEEALAALDEALRQQPEMAAVWYRRSILKSFSGGDPDFVTMERIADGPTCGYWDRLRLSFALGKAYLDIGDGERAFAWLGEGNRLKRATLVYDGGADERRFADIARRFSQQTILRFATYRHTPSIPIFVFGMPRSGTTLVEQILASHVAVVGIGECSYINNIVESSGLLAGLEELPAEEIAALGDRYMALTGSGSLRPVDKTTLNFLYAGAIRLMLPGARMIHCRRDPLDTCLSCYSMVFSSGLEFSYDLGELGRFYRLYLELMAHWRQILPSDSFLEIDYERLVDDTEYEVHRVLEFCGLPWDENCLRFYENRRRVSSASLGQVRSPVYKTSVGRAQAFRAWLGPLEAELP